MASDCDGNGDKGGTQESGTSFAKEPSVEIEKKIDTPVHSKEDENQAAITNKALVDRIDRTDRWMIGLTAVIAAGGIVSAIIFGMQLIAMQGQLDEMKQSFAPDRAYVFSSKFEGYDKSPIQPGAVVTFWFNNFGRTPAILTIPPGAKCAYSAQGFHPLSFKADDANLVTTSGRLPEGFIIPLDKPFGPFRAQLEATAEQIGKARNGIGRIYCQAVIGYADMRDILHESHTCFFFDFSVSDFHLCPEKGANHHS